MGVDVENYDETVLTTCQDDCGARCKLFVHMDDDGIPQKITTEQGGLGGNGEHPALTACTRGIKGQLKKFHHPNRLKYPLMRKNGPRGKENSFERVSWDEALDVISEKILETKENHGYKSIMGLGQEVNLHAALNTPRGLIKRFFSTFGGCVETTGHYSARAAEIMSEITYGTPITDHPSEDWLNSDLLIFWGANPLVSQHGVTSQHAFPKAVRQGIKTVVVDPRESKTAKRAHEWIPIIPGSDTAMLLAMAHEIIDQDLHDTEFIKQNTHGFEEYRKYLFGEEDGQVKNTDWAEEKCGVSSEKISELAKEYGEADAAGLYPGWSIQRQYRGEQAARAAMMLPSITGNVGIPGGGNGGVNFAAKITLPPDSIPRPYEPPRQIFDGSFEIPKNENGLCIEVAEWADYILDNKGTEDEIKLIYNVAGNYLNQHGNVEKAVEAWTSADFIVQHEQFMSPTAKHADVVLPVCTMFERRGINEDWVWKGGEFFMYCPKFIEPKWESKSDFAIFTLLAQKLGIVNDFNPKHELEDFGEEAWLREFVDEAEFEGFDFEEFKENGIFWPDKHIHSDALPFEKQVKEGEPYNTPSGKIEISSQKLEDSEEENTPSIPRWIEDSDIPGWDTDEYPVRLITSANKYRTNSTFANVDINPQERKPRIYINEKDAEKRDIEDGDKVRVFNDIGASMAIAQVSDEIIEGCAYLPQGRWFEKDEESNVDLNGSSNNLTRSTTTPYSNATTVNTSYVDFEKNEKYPVHNITRYKEDDHPIQNIT